MMFEWWDGDSPTPIPLPPEDLPMVDDHLHLTRLFGVGQSTFFMGKATTQLTDFVAASAASDAVRSQAIIKLMIYEMNYFKISNL